MSDKNQLGPLVECPLCGSGKGYTLSEGSTFRWWRVSCADCGRDICECRSDRRTPLGGILPYRCASADEAWNEAGEYARRLRAALLEIHESPDGARIVAAEALRIKA